MMFGIKRHVIAKQERGLYLRGRSIEKILQPGQRELFRETLAWSRIDLEFASDEALIKEVQGDRVRASAWCEPAEPAGVKSANIIRRPYVGLLAGGETMKASTAESYRQRVIRVVEYIYDHLDADLTINRLAEVAYMSPYHFHRIYRELAQETLNASIRRLRLHRAAGELIRSTKPIQRIAREATYGSPEAFSRAFSQQFGEPPAGYRSARRERDDRNDGPFVAMLPPDNKEYSDMYTVEILETDPVRLIGYPHQGDYMEIGRAFEKLAIYAASHQLLNETTRSFGLYYDDPKSVDMKQLNAFASISLSEEIRLPTDNDSLQEKEIPGGTCASLVFKGPYAELEKPYDWFFGQWLPQSGYEAVDFPPFEEYLNDPKVTPPNDLLTRINCLVYKR
ncbi:MAG: AraC family transcriptional regulator [Candidatus Thiodiazotropha sp.]|jgi:AraC family transcriptional regulator